MVKTESVLIPDWPAPERVRAYSTLRTGGFSQAPFDALNLALHVGDDPATVRRNREHLVSTLDLPAQPLWLEQVHGVEVHALSGSMSGPLPATDRVPKADASVTDQPDKVCVVMTADCLPVLFCDRSGSRVAAAHAGWRGLASGVLEATVAALGGPAAEIMAWIGPAIGADRFEVGDEVRQAFMAGDPQAASAFRPSRQGHWLADMVMLARRRLGRAGVVSVYGGQWCTYSDSERFYSYRREPKTGRMASLIYLDGEK